jgi:hypothetical protein
MLLDLGQLGIAELVELQRKVTNFPAPTNG